MKAAKTVSIAKYALNVKISKIVHVHQYVNHALDVLHPKIVLTV